MGLVDRFLRRVGLAPASDVDKLQAEVESLRTKAASVPPPVAALADATGTTWGLDLPEAEAQLDAMQKVAIVYGCVHRRATKTASAQFHLFRRVKDANGEVTLRRIFQHPALDLLERVNRWTTQWEAQYLTQADLDLTGNSFWFKLRKRITFSGIPVTSPPVQMWRLPPENVDIITSEKGFIRLYMLRVNGKEIPIDPDDMLHHRLPNPLDPWRGLSPLQAATLAISGDYMAAKWANSTIKKGGRLAGVITGQDLDERRIKLIETQWKQKHGGPDAVGGWAFLPGDLTAQKFSMTPQEMDFLGLRRFTREEIASVIYGVPLSKLGITEQVNRANMKESDEGFLRDTMAPMLIMIAQRFTEFLIQADYGDPDLVMLPDNIVPDDMDLLSQVDSRYLAADVVTVNEVRARRNLGDPVPWGDKPRSERLFGARGGDEGGEDDEEKDDDRDSDQDEEEEDEEEQEEGEGDDDKGSAAAERRAHLKHLAAKLAALSDEERSQQYIALISPREARLVRRLKRLFQGQQREVTQKVRSLAEQERSASKDSLPPSDRGPLDVEALLFDTAEAERQFREAGTPVMAEAMEAAGSSALAELEMSIAFDITEPQVAAFLQRKVFRFAREVNQGTKEALRATLLEGWNAGETIPELAERVADVFEEAKTWRATRIARTEINSVANGGIYQAWVMSKLVERKRWLSTRDERTRRPPDSRFNHVAAHGEEVPLQAPFVKTGQALMFPGDPDGDPGNIINCRCTMRPLVKAE